MRGDKVTKVKKRTKDGTVRNSYSRAWHEEAVLAKQETTGCKNLSSAHRLRRRESCKEERLRYGRKPRKNEDQEQMAGFGSQKLPVAFTRLGSGPGGKQKPACKDMKSE